MTQRERIRRYVARHAGLTATQIAHALALPPASVSSTLVKMGRAGEVSRYFVGDTTRHHGFDREPWRYYRP